MNDQSSTMEDRLEMLEVVIHGNPKINAIGLMKRVSDIEDIVRRWQNMETMLKGALVLMTITSGVNVAGAIAFLKAVLAP